MAAARRVTQADVARLAGVSQATVSHVLSDDAVARARVGAGTRERVLDVVQRTGYTANPIAQRLAGGRNNIIGVFTYEPVFPRDGGDFYYPLLVGIEREAEALGLDLLLFTSAPVHDGRRRLLDDGARRIGAADGCLLLGRHDDKRDLAELLQRGFPFAFVGRRQSDAGLVPYAAFDYAGATDEVVTHLVDLGHTAIGFLGDLGPWESHVDRREGYQRAIRRAGLRPVMMDGTSVDASTALDLVLANGLTAVVIGDFVLPPAMLDAARRRGLDVPGLLSMAQLGDPADPTRGTSWTGFRLPREAMGAKALRILHGIITGTLDESEQQVTLPCMVDIGVTAGPAPRRAVRRRAGAGDHA